ncbi:DNA-3-methyladenine glycosylase family protein [Nocardioides alcanivorans]|uniref:DNA-3-methyladenine glycosylase family protein n=1 Tax=Nocardioides alcanivorans TaxID=2897352 RepID=UPI001F3DE93F|nr:DNA-3-methyladenine glycosylase 2 family protein [Nocardioides alcanivorans]
MLDGLPDLLGAADDWSDFRELHPLVSQARRAHPHWRMGRTGLLHDALLPAILEQKVTGQEAFTGYRRLVRGFGCRAPGPDDGPPLWCPPTPEAVATIPSWEWLRLPVDPARSRAAVTAARSAAALQRGLSSGSEVLDRRLRSLPGVGVWTSAETRARALGDPDAVSFGDFHVAKDVGWALTGRPVDDAAMEELLEPWRGHRRRVTVLLALAGGRRPRRGPRMAPRHHLPR